LGASSLQLFPMDLSPKDFRVFAPARRWLGPPTLCGLGSGRGDFVMSLWYGNIERVIQIHKRNRKRDTHNDDRYEEKVAIMAPPCGRDSGHHSGDYFGDHSRNQSGKFIRLFHVSSFLLLLFMPA